MELSGERRGMESPERVRSIERVIDKLSGHSMFSGERQIDMLKMCEDCRVGAMFNEDDRMLDVGERRKPRTTDDYLN